MNETLIGILGGLVGSSLTVIITKLLDININKKQHLYLLQQRYFDRKLSAAEATVTQYTILCNALFHLSILYERLSMERNGIDDIIHDNLDQQIKHQFELANNASFIVVNSIALFFDINIQFNKNRIIQNFYSLLSTIEVLQNNTDITYQNYMESSGQKKDIALKMYQQSEMALDEAYKNISASYLKFNDELKGVVQQIRSEMKQFEL